jgi:hypothetical protein
MERDRLRVAYAAETAMDAVLADSFPASDPPSWTFGVERTQLQRDQTRHEHAAQAAYDEPSDNAPSAGQRFLKGVVALVGAVGVVLLFPILIIGLPVALAVRFVLEATGWRNVRPKQA